MKKILSSEGIAALRRGAAQQVAIRIVEETGSTNADLMASLATLPSPTLLIAERQTAGRGRAGRQWHSAPGTSLTFSLAWKFNLPVQGLAGLPLAVGVALAEALGMFNAQVRLKWPNDLLHEGRKLAGILIESASVATSGVATSGVATSGVDAPRAASWAVVGIGVNMAVDAGLAARIDRPVAAIPWLTELDQDVLMATLLNHLSEALAQFEREGFAAFMARWNALHAYAGRTVAILDNGKVLHEGLAAGVDETGRFLLDTAAGRVAVVAGDVSLRAREG